MRRSALVLIIAVAGTVLAAQAPAPKATPPTIMRLYVFDCGLLNTTSPPSRTISHAARPIRQRPSNILPR